MTDEFKWLEQDLAARLGRIEVSQARERELLRKSAECLRRSEELLKLPLPNFSRGPSSAT
jgi:hypothetical protein